MLRKGQRLYANFSSDQPDERLFVKCVCHGSAHEGISVGPMLRENFFLHFVEDGEVLFDGQRVGRGWVFLLKPGKPHWLEIVSKEPFEQYWLEVGGTEADSLFGKVFGDKVILNAPNAVQSLLSGLHESVYGARDAQLGFIGLLLTALSRLSEPDSHETDQAAQYVSRAMEFLRENCGERVTASDAAKEVGISEKYLCRLFREKSGTTPTGFLRGCRLSQAKALLSGTSLSIGEIAASVGFDDRNYFSRFFKECCKLSPIEFRRSCSSQTDDRIISG